MFQCNICFHWPQSHQHYQWICLYSGNNRVVSSLEVVEAIRLNVDNCPDAGLIEFHG